MDLHLEADRHLDSALLRQAIEHCNGTLEADPANGIEARFPSGMTLSCKDSSGDNQIYAEDRKGCSFAVGLRCYLRIKGPEPDGHSSLDEIQRLLSQIADTCEARFILSFQYESTLYWRDAQGLQQA
ncbi:hypothetical protein GV819_26660 [Pseudomonas sp. Fl5BN2]|uniref:hypothetical protein n=1 Tax=unclassified Pseudomonas TaxID=196821 RepID=UPI0013790F28|nr:MULTISPECIES: hypothetical protein [unclassified Pseudomonas]NBF05882.1 hypothetical protein [Pseudomonas sp. Fl5BN2]NBF11452.1 hypothetical protein [Pseudomonas sp. Fl4BN1]